MTSSRGRVEKGSWWCWGWSPRFTSKVPCGHGNSSRRPEHRQPARPLFCLLPRCWAPESRDPALRCGRKLGRGCVCPALVQKPTFPAPDEALELVPGPALCPHSCSAVLADEQVSRGAAWLQGDSQREITQKLSFPQGHSASVLFPPTAPPWQVDPRPPDHRQIVLPEFKNAIAHPCHPLFHRHSCLSEHTQGAPTQIHLPESSSVHG